MRHNIKLPSPFINNNNLFKREEEEKKTEGDDQIQWNGNYNTRVPGGGGGGGFFVGGGVFFFFSFSFSFLMCLKLSKRLVFHQIFYKKIIFLFFSCFSHINIILKIINIKYFMINL